MGYRKYNDYELIYMVRENDDYSYNQLFNNYIPIMKKLAYSYYKNYSSYGYDYEDFQQEAYLAFHNAINNYDEDRNILFYTFVVVCIKRSLMSFSRMISCEKKNISNTYLVNIEDNDIVGESNIDDYISDVEKNSIIKNISLELDFEDSCVFELRYNGFSYKEISILLDIPLRKVQLKGRKAKKYLGRKVSVKF